MRAGSIEIIDSKRFVEATRDSGYRSVDAAIAELIDNSLEADADDIRVLVPSEANPSGSLSIAVMDNGQGMSRVELWTSLQFGGSSRFGNRKGMGRFGMGLPSSSFSQARCAEVYTWRNDGVVWRSCLDLDVVLWCKQTTIPEPSRAELPPAYREFAGDSGTLIIWSRLDRVGVRNWRQFAKRLELRIGQIYRHFIWHGCCIHVNNQIVRAFDPLFLSSDTRIPCIRAQQHGDTLKLELSQPVSSDHHIGGVVEVRFSELPIDPLAGLSGPEKRQYGIANGAGVSVVRAGREIDYGWFFMDKRRENYDDWWRCEVQFSPELDELFGISYNKQGIRPSEFLRSTLTPCLGAIARQLNRRARSAHQDYAAHRSKVSSTGIASRSDCSLHPITTGGGPLSSGHAANDSGKAVPTQIAVEAEYRLVAGELLERIPYHVELTDSGEVVVTVNTLHEFYDRVYLPLQNGGDCLSSKLLEQLQLLILAFARSEILNWSDSERDAIGRYKSEWSRAISVFLRGR